jgi:hypothetical protein
VLGDFNEDGDLDFATAHDNSHLVGVLLGNGDGTFGLATYYPVTSGPASVAAADFDGDGHLDLAVGNISSLGRVAVLLGNGDGTFQAAAYYAEGSHAFALTVGDFNEDGHPDIATANFDNTLSVLLNNGNGTFGPAVNYSMGTEPMRSVAVGDFNNDEHQDLVAVNTYYGSTAGVFVGNGNGTFQPGVEYPVGDHSTSVAVGDLNGDGNQDITAANYIGGYASVLLGNGDATFRPRLTFPGGFASNAIAVGDFNVDGRADVATANEAGNSVTVLLNTCAVAPTPTITPTGTASSTPTNTATPTNTPVLAEILVGHVLWAGPPAQPHIRQQLPLTLTLCVGSSPTTYGATTDASGFFTVTLSLPPGSYNWWVKGPKYLATAGTANLLNGTTQVEMGIQRAGDIDNAHDNRVNAVDFNVMKTTYGTASTAGDLNNDGLTNLFDFQIFRTYFGTAGAPPNCP